MYTGVTQEPGRAHLLHLNYGPQLVSMRDRNNTGPGAVIEGVRRWVMPWYEIINRQVVSGMKETE